MSGKIGTVFSLSLRKEACLPGRQGRQVHGRIGKPCSIGGLSNRRRCFLNDDLLTSQGSLLFWEAGEVRCKKSY